MVAGRLLGDRLIGHEELDQDGDVLVQGWALLARVDADHGGIGGEGTRAQAEHEPAAGEVVEEHGPVGHPQRVVVRQGHHPGAELDVIRLGGHVTDEDLR